MNSTCNPHTNAACAQYAEHVNYLPTTGAPVWLWFLIAIILIVGGYVGYRKSKEA